ncbi:MAG: FAD-binding oxidoreductase, partial [Deltaproteobacteria bacterium]
MATSEPLIDDEKLLEELAGICGERWVSTSQPDRLAYARDMWPRCLIRQRAGLLDHPPDVVVWPADEKQVAAIIEVASRYRMGLIPFGAGSGVCGATLPHRGGIVCDLKRLDSIVDVDQRTGTVEVQAGIIGEVLERRLNGLGLSCGHFPSSMYCSTVGGWVAARGAGQCSSRYGKIEDMVVGLDYVDWQGRLRRVRHPRCAGHWTELPLLLGSEGTLGIITSVRMAVHRLPEERWFRAFRFPDVESGLDAIRLVLREGLRPSVMRLYDEFDTMIASRGGGEDDSESLLHRISKSAEGPLRHLLRLSLPRLLASPKILNRLGRMSPLGCQLVVVYEGSEAELELAATIVPALCRSTGGTDLGEEPARAWWSNRYAVSYKQSKVFEAGAFVDTMEVATTWDRLASLYHAVRKEVEPIAFVMAHFSHAWREGCSVYFTFVGAGRDESDSAKVYDTIWLKAQQAVRKFGGVVSHHHGIGLLKTRFLKRQLESGWPVLSAVRQTFDPYALFNPGKLEDSQEPYSAPAAGVEDLQGVLDSIRLSIGRRALADGWELRASERKPVAVIKPSSPDELGLVVARLYEASVPWVVTSSGSALGRLQRRKFPKRFVAIDLGRLNGIESCSEQSLWVSVGAGTPLGEVAQYCRERNLRIAGNPDGGSSVGGWISRGAWFTDPVLGLPASPVLALEVVLPDGRKFRSVPSPRASTGPCLESLWLGTWGVLGIVASAVLK